MDQAGLSYMQDLFLLIVAIMAVSLLVVNMPSLSLARVEENRHLELDEEARRLCAAIQTAPDLTYEGQDGILDRTALEESSEESFRSALKIEGHFMIEVITMADETIGLQERWTWSTSLPPNGAGICVSSSTVWFSEDDVRAARLTVRTWRAR